MARQWSRLRSTITIIYTPVAIALAVVVVVRMRTGIAIADFTVDPLIVVGGAPVYTGILSTIGGLVWASTMAICLFGWATARTWPRSDQSASFLLAAGIVTLVLMVDDVFLGHEILYPQYVGLDERVVYAIYGVMILGFMAAFRAVILRTDFLLLAIALAGFALSIAFDVIAELTNVAVPAAFLWEDGAKLFALVSWAAYFIMTTSQYIQGGARLPAPDPGERRS